VQALQTSVAVLFSIGVEFDDEVMPHRSWLRFGRKRVSTNGETAGAENVYVS
jgi:hypothetical protein